MLHWLLPTFAAMMPLVEASDFTTPGWPMYLAIAAVVIGFLVLRFVIKTAITLIKLGIVLGIAAGIYILFTLIRSAIAG